MKQIPTQKLNGHRCKQQFETYSFTHWQFSARYICCSALIKATIGFVPNVLKQEILLASFNRSSYSSLQVFPGYRQWQTAKFNLHEFPQEKFDGLRLGDSEDQEVTTIARTTAQATAY